jgi:hypothetical protein
MLHDSWNLQKNTRYSLSKSQYGFYMSLIIIYIYIYIYIYKNLHRLAVTCRSKKWQQTRQAGLVPESK